MSKFRAAKHPPTPTPPPASPFKNRGPRAGELEDKRLAVLRTAAELFAAQGFHRTTLTEVADRLDITKPAIYYYFSSKDEILIGCVRAALEATHRYFVEEDDARRDGRARLERFMIWFGESMADPFGKCLVRVAQQDLAGETQAELIAAERVVDRRVRQLIEVGIKDGSIGSCDVKIAAFTIAGALGRIGHWHRAGGKLSAREAAARVAALLLDGLPPGWK